MKKLNVIDKEGVYSIIEILENGKGYEDVPAKQNKDGSINIGFTNYDDGIMKLFGYIPFYEKDYNKNMDKIIKKDIFKLTYNETIQYLTFIYRKDRFIDGHIATYIDNGILLKLLKHLLDIC